MPSILTAIRLRAFADGKILLGIQTNDGRTEEILVSVGGLRTIVEQGESILKIQGAKKKVKIEWAPTRYQKQPGDNGHFQVGLAPDEHLVALLVRTPEGIEVELLLPENDASRLLQGVGAALNALRARSPDQIQ